jgi:hypothetical protein
MERTMTMRLMPLILALGLVWGLAEWAAAPLTATMNALAR